MPELEWFALARADLLEIVAYISDDNSDAAQRVMDNIEAKVAKLPDFPKIGRPGRIRRNQRIGRVGKLYHRVSKGCVIMSKRKFFFRYLAYAGTLPFIASAGLITVGVAVLPYYGDVLRGVLCYGLVIASFMSGIHWGQYLFANNSITINLFISSNILAIGLWLSYLLLSPFCFCLILLVTFIALLVIDISLYRNKVIDAHYFNTRMGVTAIVCLTLGYLSLFFAVLP